MTSQMGGPRPHSIHLEQVTNASSYQRLPYAQQMGYHESTGVRTQYYKSEVGTALHSHVAKNKTL